MVPCARVIGSREVGVGTLGNPSGSGFGSHGFSQK